MKAEEKAIPAWRPAIIPHASNTNGETSRRRTTGLKRSLRKPYEGESRHHGWESVDRHRAGGQAGPHAFHGCGPASGATSALCWAWRIQAGSLLGRFEISTENSDSLDLGSSTGGFTDCLLQSGARSVTCVDVGRGQLHGKLRKDGRVHVREGLNARHLESDDLPLLAYDLVTLDLSFISLRKVLQRAWSFLRPGGKLIALVKPQFEATKEEADAGRGIIRNPEIHDRVVQGISSFAEKELEGSLFIGCVESPLRGAEGNIEFLLGWEKGASEG